MPSLLGHKTINRLMSGTIMLPGEQLEVRAGTINFFLLVKTRKKKGEESVVSGD